MRYEWKSNYPIVFYLISLAVADYREYNLEVQPDGITSGPGEEGWSTRP
ncbi:MAG: hypothetical protein KAR16_06330 [Bacteroidales bacterium]|nr:hypothetical protein [Bacteroidales bacterium]